MNTCMGVPISNLDQNSGYLRWGFPLFPSFPSGSW